MLVIIIATDELIISKKFMMYLIANADLVPKTGVNKIVDIDDAANSASSIPIGTVGNNI